MGGKTATSTQAVSIPPQVLAQYQSVNAQANQTAQTPFQQYGGQFVAPVNTQQQAGISGVNAGANVAQPYYGQATGQINNSQAATQPINQAATGLAAQSAGAVDPSNLDAAAIDKYLSPYLGTVLGSESALLNQNNQQQQAGQLGTAISSGAFGGDRTGIAAANLEQQQNLANANIYSNILNTGYGQALGTAQQQQGVGLAAGQANRAAVAAAGQELSGIGATQYGEGANTATTLAGLGSGAQTAALTGAQAQIGAGTVEQQTQQAQDTALYNQFLQQQSYPFQVDQFLANIAEGTGALSGSTTTTQQPGGFFSDKRLKYDLRKIGKTYDGQHLYSYKMHGDPRTHVGLIAQEVEKKHPQSVGVASGYKFVDYGKATEKAANRGHFHEGGGVSGGGRVWQPGAYAVGGSPSIVDPQDMAAILQAQRAGYAPHSSGTGVYGSTGLPHGGSAAVPAPSGAVSHLVTANGSGLKPRPSGASNVVNIMDAGRSAAKLYGQIEKDNAPTGTPDPDMSRGGVAARSHYDAGGSAGGGLDAVLQAQQNMYTPQRQNRDIPAQGSGAHQLAVASGSPTPPTSGASNVNTSIGLAQKGYSAYKHFNPSSTSTSGGPSASQAAAEGPAAPGAGVSPAAADAAASEGPAAGASGVAAPTAAATTAAPAAADAAGAAGGAAAGAAGAGAVDAGAADAAAALAAEYAAADAAVAVAAAKRGGRIRGKFDAGGTPYEATSAGDPYSEPGGQIIIPDDQNSTKLQTAGALKKQPTGLQTLETLGTQEGAQGAMSGMFSNSALARGGGVAARRKGYDAGGSPDDPTTEDVPMAAPDSGISGGPAAPTPMEDAPSGVAPAKKTWWDKIKGSPLADAHNLVPLLSAIGAMGSAPTRSWGTALATGLGAGAASYVPTQTGLADVQQTQARTRGVDIQNQIAATQLGALRGALSPQSSQPVTQPSVPPPTDSSALPSYFAQKYNPNMTPQELQRYNSSQVAGGMIKNPGLAQSVMTDYQQRIARQTQDANLQHDQAYSVATAPNGNFRALAKVDPVPAAAIAKSLGFDPASKQIPATADEAAKQYATAKVNYIHPWTGAPDYKDEGGTTRDTRTGKPAIGPAAQTLTAEQKQQNYQQAFAQANEPVTTGAGLPTLRYKTAGYPSPDAYAAHVTGGSGPLSTGGQQTGAPPPRPASPPQSVSNVPTPTAPTSAQTQMLSGIDMNAFPKLPPLPAAVDQPTKARADKRAASDVDVQNESMGSLSQQAAASARNTAIYSQLEKTLAQANPREFGPGSKSFKALADLKTYLTGLPPDGLVNQAEVDKYLTQLGVGGSKQLLGADQQLRQQEMLMLMSHANPNLDQPLQVIKNLAAYGRAGNEYDLKAANTGIAAIRNGADPFAVPGSIESQVHRSDYVNGRLNTPQSAIDHLKAHPELAPHFKAKYGYLP